MEPHDDQAVTLHRIPCLRFGRRPNPLKPRYFMATGLSVLGTMSTRHVGGRCPAGAPEPERADQVAGRAPSRSSKASRTGERAANTDVKSASRANRCG